MLHSIYQRMDHFVTLLVRSKFEKMKLAVIVGVILAWVSSTGMYGFQFINAYHEL